MRTKERYAYAQGYFMGRTTGVQQNIFQEPDLRALNDEGYDKGLEDYCEFDEPNQATKKDWEVASGS